MTSLEIPGVGEVDMTEAEATAWLQGMTDYMGLGLCLGCVEIKTTGRFPFYFFQSLKQTVADDGTPRYVHAVSAQSSHFLRGIGGPLTLFIENVPPATASAVRHVFLYAIDVATIYFRRILPSFDDALSRGTIVRFTEEHARSQFLIIKTRQQRPFAFETVETIQSAELPQPIQTLMSKARASTRLVRKAKEAEWRGSQRSRQKRL